MDTFHAVARVLFSDEEDDQAFDEAFWDGCEKGRFKSAVSRAYYHAFQVVKHELLAARAFPFPQSDIHAKLLHVFRKSSLPSLADADRDTARRIGHTLRQLLRLRGAADYEWARRCGVQHVRTALALSRTIEELTQGLSAAARQALASELVAVDAAWTFIRATKSSGMR